MEAATIRVSEQSCEAKGLTKIQEQEMGPEQERVGQVQTGKQVDGQLVKKATSTAEDQTDPRTVRESTASQSLIQRPAI